MTVLSQCSSPLLKIGRGAGRVEAIVVLRDPTVVEPAQWARGPAPAAHAQHDGAAGRARRLRLGAHVARADGERGGLAGEQVAENRGRVAVAGEQVPRSRIEIVHSRETTHRRW